MTITRRLAVPALAAVVLLSLTGCFGNLLGGGSSTTGVQLAGTSWSGTDSDGDATTFDFDADGTVGVTYNENSYDDPGDTWSLSGSTVTISVFINADTGTAVYTGDVAGTTMDLSAVTDDGSAWTVVLTKD